MKNVYLTGVAATVVAIASQTWLVAPAMAQANAGADAQPQNMPASNSGAGATPGAGAVPQATADDIIVTARRVGESLLSVPVQVTVQTGDQLARTNANNLTKIAESIPFVSVGRMTGGNGGGYTVRGIGNFSNDVSVKQTVLLNQDNIFIGRGKIINQGQYDIAQVEVLKGPQALFYGRNSPAGVISISTKDPGQELEGFVRGGYEFKADERILEAGVSVPLTDTLAVRVAGRAQGMTGYLRNNAPAYAVNPFFASNPTRFAYLANSPVPGNSRRAPNTDELAARTTVVWRPTDALKVRLKYAYGITHEDGDSSTIEVTCRPGVTAVTSLGVRDPANDCKLDQVTNNGRFPVNLTVNHPGANGGVPYSRTRTHLTSLSLDYTGETLSVSSITGYYNLAYNGAQVSNQDSIGSNFAAQLERSTGFSEEVRIASEFDFPVNFVVGGYYGRTKQRNETYANLLAFGFGLDPTNNSYLTYHRLIQQSNTTLSGFAQLRWKIFDTLELDGGVRYTREKVSDFDGNEHAHPAATLPPLNAQNGGVYFDRSRTFSNYSPEATLTWHPDPDQTIYASYKTGFKSGGFATPPVFTKFYTDQSTRYDPEKVRGFEVGYKAQLLDRRLTVDLSAYRYDYKDLQANVFVAASFGFITVNAAQARVQGIEAQASFRPIDGLTLNASLGYNEAKYRKFIGGGCYAGQTLAQGCFPFNGSNTQDLGGRTLPRAPKWGSNLGFVYETPVSDDFKMTFSGNTIYSSSFLLQDNLDPFAKQDSYWKVNAAVSIATEDDKYELSLIGRNLTDKYTAVTSQDKGQGTPGNYGYVMTRPIEVMLQATARF